MKNKNLFLKNPLQNKKGFTIIEVLIASALSMLVIYSILSLMLEAQTAVNKSGTEMGLKTEFDIQVNDLSKYIGNSVRLDPPENYTGNDKKYHGIIAMQNAFPTVCKYDADPIAKTETYSILRMTSLRKKFNPKRLLRSWQESSSGLVGPTHELRVSYVPGEDELHPVDATLAPKEVILFEADGYIVRRYKVAAIRKIANTDKDPFDDVDTRLNPDGTPRLYTYTAMDLEMPKNALDEVQTPDATLRFLTNSMLYISDTEYLCVDTNKKKLIRTSQNDFNNQKTFLDVTNEKFNFDRFQVRFSLTKDLSARVDPTTFKYYRFWDDPKDEGCINIVDFSVMMLVDRRSSQVESSMGRTQILNNFNNSRPAGCSQP
ncbi:MAG: PilW family protein [Pseudobdellovibrionaceae bacterium]